MKALVRSWKNSLPRKKRTQWSRLPSTVSEHFPLPPLNSALIRLQHLFPDVLRDLPNDYLIAPWNKSGRNWFVCALRKSIEANHIHGYDAMQSIQLRYIPDVWKLRKCQKLVFRWIIVAQHLLSDCPLFVRTFDFGHDSRGKAEFFRVTSKVEFR